MYDDFKTVILNLRLQYYVPFVLVSGYLFWYPAPQQVNANQTPGALPVLEDSDPSTWPQPEQISPEFGIQGPDEGFNNLPIVIDVPVIGGTDEAELPKLSEPVPPPNLTIESSAPISPPPSIDSSSEVGENLPINRQAGQNDIQPVPSLNGNDLADDDEEKTEEFIVPEITSPYQSDEYRLTVGDTISVLIANIPEFTTKDIIRSDGNINLPVAGRISVWDMTLPEAEQAITKHYVEADVLRAPDISVQLLASSPLKIAIAGEINRPGAYDVPVLDKKLPTITDALKVAGGIASEPDLRNVELYRHNRKGGQDLIKINLMALYQDADLSQNVTLRSGDRIIVPTAPVRPEEAQLIGAANVAPDTMQVGLLGEVLSPGIIQAPTNTALNQALILVGGFNSRAKKTVQLVRTMEDGSVTREKIKIDWSANVGDEQNPVLQHRDVILVGPNAIAKYSDFLDRAIGPINRTIPFIGILDLLFPSNRN